MTFHESYGHLPKSTLALLRKYNASPADYDTVLRGVGCTWDSPNIPFDRVDEILIRHSSTGTLRLPFYM